MKRVTGGKPKKKFNAYVLIIAALSFILALTVGEVIVYVFQYINAQQSIVNDGLLITLFIIPAIAVVVTCVIIYLTHRTLQTANTLTEALNKVAHGDYNAKIPYKRQDNFNVVYESFNKMTDELKSVKALRDDFVHDFSHEFKTPIASINGFANMLAEESLTEEERQNIIKIIADESARLSSLAETMLMLSRLENQQFITESKTYRLDVQLKDCIILLSREWEKKNIEVQTSLFPVQYTGDENLLKQVWLNLISNAVKFTPEGGRIGVALTVQAGRAVVKVSDTGIGIPPECLPKIFDKYYQFKPGAGNGLGLAICYRICKLCGAKITVSSRVGEGSVFTVTL